jgi:GxxExxY protein
VARVLLAASDVPLEHSPIVEGIIGCAIAVHKGIGPGLLESAYTACLAYKFVAQGIAFKREVPLPVVFEGCRLDCGYRLDFVVEDAVVVEIKSVERLLPLHSAQVMTYIKLANLRHGLLINFNVPVLKDGVRSLLNPMTSTLPTLPTCERS